LNGTPLKDSQGHHAALMDQVYRHQRHFYDFTRKYYLLGRDRMVRDLTAKAGDSIVEIGCGTARNLIRIAQLYPGTRLYGLDASAEMLQTAKEAVERAQLSDRVTLVYALAEDLSPGLFGRDEPFDHIIFSYSLSMIPDWRLALDRAAACVEPRGFVHVVDFGDLAGMWGIAARALRGWLNLFHVVPRDELLNWLEAGTVADSGCSLSVWPGRYAFVLKASPSFICELSEQRRRS